MDTSETYIKMCQQAKEIQRGKEWIGLGDFFYNTTTEKVEILDISALTGGFIWLPRQDQLQEIFDQSWYRTINRFYDAITDEGYADPNDEDFQEKDLNLRFIQQFNSFEQLWLAFVMHEKFNKTWNGERWVNG